MALKNNSQTWPWEAARLGLKKDCFNQCYLYLRQALSYSTEVSPSYLTNLTKTLDTTSAKRSGQIFGAANGTELLQIRSYQNNSAIELKKWQKIHLFE